MPDLTVREMVDFLRRLPEEQSINKVIAFKCGRCDGSPHPFDRIEMDGPRFEPTLPQPAAKGVEHQSDLTIEGVATNSDVRSWCHHDDSEVTIEILQHVTLPIGFVAALGALPEDERNEMLIQKVGVVIVQTCQSLGYHCGEVESCQKTGGPCAHKAS